MKQTYKLIIPLLAIAFYSCKKDWLDAKPNKNLVEPKTLEDFQAMLDNDIFVFNGGQPALGEIGCDDYYVRYDNWQSLYTNTERNAYVWAQNVYNNEPVPDWMLPYQRIFYENYILENIDNITPDDASLDDWNNVKGCALFGRGFDFYSLADVFAEPYDRNSADTDLGIPIRVKTDINIKSSRATVQETYDQILADLKQSTLLLPVTPAYKTRPSKPAAYAMLARTYLSMGNYENALLYADSALQLSNSLIDYNILDVNAYYPFSIFNDEVIYHVIYNYPEILSNYISIVDSNLYRSYDANDLRKYLYFDTSDGNPRFKGGYDGYTDFAGIATDEIYLIRAECYARTGDVAHAVADLNTLLSSRYKAGTFTPYKTTDASDALAKILTERRKELLYRGLRWTDLRRLNKDSRFAITLKRNLNGEIYTLPPNDVRYVYPIPDEEIRISGFEQNPR